MAKNKIGNRTKNCPMCNSVAGRWKAGPAKGRLTCWNNNCLLVDNHFDDETWNKLPRRDPLAKQKDRLVLAAVRHYSDGYMGASGLVDATLKFMAAKDNLRVRRGKK